jgi:hypothetical protein
MCETEIGSFERRALRDNEGGGYRRGTRLARSTRRLSRLGGACGAQRDVHRSRSVPLVASAVVTTTMRGVARILLANTAGDCGAT